MDAEQLTHLERISRCSQALRSISWIDDIELQAIVEDLLDFDSRYWIFTKYLSLPLYEELERLLMQASLACVLPVRPTLAVVVPVFEPSQELLEQALASLRQQVGVAIECLISVDGRRADLAVVERVLAGLGQEDQNWRVSLFFCEENGGVARCRNRAMREISAPLFTWLDDDDLFHPLRCLHGLLVMALKKVSRVNTSWSRVSIKQRKIVLLNDRLSSYGHNSFIARTELLSTYGYLADLRTHEDTEYMRRMEFFRVPLVNSAVVGHYLHTEPTSDYNSLASPWRKEVYAIKDHPYLCGSVIGRDEVEFAQQEDNYQRTYEDAIKRALCSAFPAI